MKFLMQLALVSLSTLAAAKDYEFDMFYPSPPATGCGGTPEHISDNGSKGCSTGFHKGAASSWKLSGLKDGCVVTFYADRDCKESSKLDWIDGKSPNGQCKTMPNYTAARAFDVKCS
ncbi:hypothetical protein GGS26DRAFT_579023 [Hypomontagnella submonticulosa]|nr:hypothetical protein GGS26DRAFT_579023 [Hypomontagnella submonticulosa]